MNFIDYVIAEGLISENPLDPSRLFAHYSAAFDATQARTKYGRRDEKALERSYALIWSNGSNRWDVGRPIKKGEVVSMDANVILISATNTKEAGLIAKFLPPLPLSGFSAENNPLLKLAPNATADQVDQAVSDYADQELVKSPKQTYFDRLLDYYNQELKG